MCDAVESEFNGILESAKKIEGLIDFLVKKNKNMSYHNTITEIKNLLKSIINNTNYLKKEIL